MQIEMEIVETCRKEYTTWKDASGKGSLILYIPFALAVEINT